MKWLERCLGIGFHGDDVMIRRACAITPCHVEMQAPAVNALFWSELDRLLDTAGVFRLALAVFWNMLSSNVLRPKHLQPSILTLLQHRLEGWAELGKAKVDGHRRPFYWSAPRLTFGGRGLGATVQRLADAAGTP